MDPKEAKGELERIRRDALGALDEVEDLDSLEKARVAFLGRRSALSGIASSLREMAEESRREVGRRVNETRRVIEEALEARRLSVDQAAEAGRLAEETLDVSLPGRRPERGRRNPLTIVIEDVVDALVGLGFSVVEGPEVETDYYNFQALNIPEDHPARSEWDTLYLEVDEGREAPMFRTHTSPVQARVMESQPPPVYVAVPGRCARQETVSAARLASFIQIEGLAVDYGITMADLRGTLEAFAKAVFGEEQRVRLIPDYFPFTEPSAGVEVLCFNCGGAGCRTCKKEGWIELMGAGMVHPNVFKEVGYPEDITGFAFGMGVERVAMARYGVEDIRWFYENDMRFLEAF